MVGRHLGPREEERELQEQSEEVLSTVHLGGHHWKRGVTGGVLQ